MGPIIHLVLRLKFTMCVGRVGRTFTVPWQLLERSPVRFPTSFCKFLFLVSEGFEPTCTDLRSAFEQNITTRPKMQREFFIVNWTLTILNPQKYVMLWLCRPAGPGLADRMGYIVNISHFHRVVSDPWICQIQSRIANSLSCQAMWLPRGSFNSTHDFLLGNSTSWPTPPR